MHLKYLLQSIPSVKSAYYHYYTGEEWRDVAGYDLCLDTSKYGIDGCVQKVQEIIKILV